MDRSKQTEIDYEPMAGDHIESACSEAVATAHRLNRNVVFKFNDQTITATPTSNPDELSKAYSTECQRSHDEYIASPEYRKQQEEYALAEKRKASALANALVSAPKYMSLKDEAGWKKACAANTDPYGGAVMRYAETWARLMEDGISKGRVLDDIADETSHLADNEGLTGFMFGAAVSTLARVWIYGEDLRRWHNLKTQIRDEGEKANVSGGVLNPALLTIGK